MNINKSYSFYSALQSVAGLLFLLMTYMIAPDHPAGMIKIIMAIMLGLAIILLITGIATSILSIKRKELGVTKYIGLLIPVLIVLFILLMPFIIGIGFIINDQP